MEEVGFYWWLIAMFDLVIFLLPIFIIFHFRGRTQLGWWWNVVMAGLIFLLAVGCLAIIVSYPHVLRGQVRQAVTIACTAIGTFLGLWMTRRPNESGGSFQP